jgi:hypothetical protein
MRPQEWYQRFRQILRETRWSDPLRDAALSARLGAWTELLTGAVVATCAALGWQAVAKGYPDKNLPVPKQEYLAIDVMAFPSENLSGWRRPLAAFELENSSDVKRVSYALWKVCLLRCDLIGVFCYCRRPEDVGQLISPLGDAASQVYPAQAKPPGLLLVVGTRAKAESFPDGFFKPYVWEASLRQFRLLW